MTENEAIKYIENHGYIDDEVKDMAIQALEEIQQYKAIGNIEEFKALKEDKNFLEFLYNHIPPNEMEQYLSMYNTKDKVAVNGYADQSGLMSAT